ncbi:unnamed protein product [Ceratitis capitata]|uniref:(Mediterranean fruit fly) hypothetical protein n=1 Tax=Ceratitis capitata TaxID=7213 RepID=A0A811UC54_CERCA|nr:unnamed protein product [Ceratitis capitata]
MQYIRAQVPHPLHCQPVTPADFCLLTTSLAELQLHRQQQRRSCNAFEMNCHKLDVKTTHSKEATPQFQKTKREKSRYV